MGKVFWVEFQRYPLKFHTKYLTHTLKDVQFIHKWKFKILDLRAHTLHGLCHQEKLMVTYHQLYLKGQISTKS